MKRAWGKYNRTKDAQDKTEYTKIKNEVKTAIREEKRRS